MKYLDKYTDKIRVRYNMYFKRDDFQVSGKILKLARLVNEWYLDLEDPDRAMSDFREAGLKADIFTFWQRLPDISPKFQFYHEIDPVAVLPITSYDEWWNETINVKTRNMVRRAEKKGVEIRVVPYDDDFVRGLVELFNETPIRQGRPFTHYGKNFEEIKAEFAKNIEKEEIIGAYYQNKLIGFIMLAAAGPFSMFTQILSRIDQRDKAPNNALVAKAIELCAENEVKYLVYAMWVLGNLGKFKQHNGFVKYDLPRYYVPLTLKGRIALKLGLHKGVMELLPERMSNTLKQYRQRYYFKKHNIVIPTKKPSEQ